MQKETSNICKGCGLTLFKTIPHKCVWRTTMEMDAARFRELVKRRDQAHQKMEDARAAKKSADEAYESSQRHFSEAANNLQDYVQECAGDPALGSYRR